MFVGLSILVQQLRTERRVDVFTVTRKLRSQRQALINSFVSTLCIACMCILYGLLLFVVKYGATTAAYFKVSLNNALIQLIAILA